MFDFTLHHIILYYITLHCNILLYLYNININHNILYYIHLYYINIDFILLFLFIVH